MAIQRRDTSAGVRYIARYRGPDGRERSKTCTRRKDAAEWLAEREREVRLGVWVDPRDQAVTVQALLEGFTSQASNKRTRQVRKFCADNLGDLAGVPLSKLRPSDVRAWVGVLSTGRPWAGGTRLSPSSVRQVLATLKAALNTAVVDRIIVTSPAEHVAAPRVGDGKVFPDGLLTLDQVKWVADAASDSAALGFWIAATTGLRGGEVAGLRVRSLDFLRGTVTVSEQSTGRSKPWTWEPVKTARSRRVVPVPKVTVERAAGYLAGRNATPDEPLLLTRTGGQWSSATLGEAWTNAAKAVGVDGFTLHDLRHRYASALISAGVSPQGVADLLGHESAVTTLRVYSHLFPGDSERARGAIENELRDFCGISSSGREAK